MNESNKQQKYMTKNASYGSSVEVLSSLPIPVEEAWPTDTH